MLFYSAAQYQTITLESENIARSIATGLSQELDFPKLVNRIYDDGAKIFIEAGAGSVCSRWLDKILEDKEHITVSLNRRGLDDHTSFIKALAKLVSHRVAVNLSPLYSPVTEISKLNKAMLRTVTLGGDAITGKILSAENRQLFQEIADKFKQEREQRQQQQEILGITALKSANSETPPQPGENSPENIIEHVLEPEEQLKSSELTATQPITPQDFLSPIATDIEFATIINMLDLNKAQYQKLNANNARITQNHTAFLKAREDFSKQLSEIIHLQMVCAEDLLKEEAK